MERAGTLPGAEDVGTVVATLVDGVASVLEFRRVAVAAPEAGGYRVVASRGWPEDELGWLEHVDRRLADARPLGPAVVLEPRPRVPAAERRPGLGPGAVAR